MNKLRIVSGNGYFNCYVGVTQVACFKSLHALLSYVEAMNKKVA